MHMSLTRASRPRPTGLGAGGQVSRPFAVALVGELASVGSDWPLSAPSWTPVWTVVNNDEIDFIKVSAT
ncbi:MAG: hypothetical protein RLY82_1190 [Pseudomonadota bacterium]